MRSAPGAGLRFFYPQPFLLDPAGDRGLVSLDRAAYRLLNAPPHLVEQFRDVIHVVRHSKARADDRRDSRTRPEICTEPMGLSTLEKNHLESSAVRALQFPRTARGGFRS